MTVTPKTNDLTTEWHAARLLYPLYAALAREFVIDPPPCADLESGVDGPSEESVEQARQWFLDMDQRIQVHQLRQFLQTTTLTSEEGLRTLLEHHLQKAQRSDSDRDKTDFLLVQFFSHCAPSRLEDADVDMEYVAQVLKLKASAGENYFTPVAMVAFTRFSFLMRRVFFRLMHQDLNAILDGLRELELRGVSSLDCRSAQFSADEPVARLRMICFTPSILQVSLYACWWTCAL